MCRSETAKERGAGEEPEEVHSEEIQPDTGECLTNRPWPLTGVSGIKQNLWWF